jgi:DNA-binding NtrC family response regulator
VILSTVLVVDDDREMRSMLEEDLAEAGFRVVTAAGGDEALERLGAGGIDLVVTDLVMPGMKGDRLLAEVRVRHADVPVLIMTGFGSIDSAVEAMKAGAAHYLAKPFQLDQLVVAVEAALRDRGLRIQLQELRSAGSSGLDTIVAESPATRHALDLVRRSALVDSSVLIRGESGTGKELLAQALHLGGPRRDGPFVAINCSAIPETLLESQLFGHRRGSFTDAREDRRGLFLEAERGSLFLDEIGDMPPALQSKLLRVIQEREIHPIGAPAPVPVDVRIVAATHRNLEQLVQDGAFRQDLYYRLNVIEIRVPPLRERPEDLVPLVAHFLRKHGARLGRPGVTVAPQAMGAMRRHAWPGNVRELENVIERALVLGRDDVIRPEDLPESLRARPTTGDASEVRLLADVERDQILRALRRVNGNKAAAARLLGLDRKTLYRRLQQYGLSGR